MLSNPLFFLQLSSVLVTYLFCFFYNTVYVDCTLQVATAEQTFGIRAKENKLLALYSICQMSACFCVKALKA